MDFIRISFDMTLVKMGPFSESKEMALPLFLPVQFMPGQCICNLTILCQSVIILLNKLQNSCMVKFPYLHVICALISSVHSASQNQMASFVRNKNRCNEINSLYWACLKVYKIEWTKFAVSNDINWPLDIRDSAKIT